MDKIIIYSQGIVALSICASNECTISEVTKYANTTVPTGIQSEWSLSEEPFQTGEPNPCPCDKYPKDRKHYLFTC